jgi:hypothetical protein
MEDFGKDSEEALKAHESDDSSGSRETEYLLSSPKNAERLLGALARLRQSEGVPETVEELRNSVGLA